MRACKVGSINITLNNWFLLLIVLFSFFGMTGKVLGVFAAILWHECAHAMAAMGLGYKVREIELLPFGGVARIERLSEAGAANEFIIAVAGPLASLLLAAIIYMIMLFTGYWSDILIFHYNTNIVLALFNLLPGLPLDGGRMFRALLSIYLGYNKATSIAVGCSKIISVILLILVVAELIIAGFINLTFIAAAIFLYVTAQTELNIASFRIMRILARKKADLAMRGVMPTNQFTALTNVAVRDVMRLFCPEQYCIVLIIDDNYHIKGSLTETELWEALPARGIYAKIGDFL